MAKDEKSQNLSEQSVEELQDRLHELMQRERDAKQEARRITDALDRKIRKQVAEARLSVMSDSERRAIAQELRAAGITSEEAAGKVKN